jgi:glycerate kinase
MPAFGRLGIMRVLIAPDSLHGELTAVEAAVAIAEGWCRWAPDDELELRPMSDGGPGFCAVVQHAVGGELHLTTVRDAYGADVPAGILLAGFDTTAYVEAAQPCGGRPEGADPAAGSSFGVGQLIRTSLDAGARRIVVGLGGVATSDGGAGMLAALGAAAAPDGALLGGVGGLASLASVDLAGARRLLRDVELIAATDVDNPLLGLRGASNALGRARGIGPDRALVVDGMLRRLAELTDPDLVGARGAGAAGGLGFGLGLLGGRFVRGLDLVADLAGLVPAAARCDLVVTAERSFDVTSRSGTVPFEVASIAATALRPCIVLAARVELGAREMRAIGVESAYALEGLTGRGTPPGSPADDLGRLAERVARTWSPRRRD